MKQMKNTLVTTVRCSVTDLATLASYYTEIASHERARPQTRGALVRFAIEDFAATLVANGKILPIEDPKAALAILSNLGIVNDVEALKVQRQEEVKKLEVL